MGNFRNRITGDLTKGGVTVLDDRTVSIKLKGQALSVLGLNDYDVDQRQEMDMDMRRKLLREFQQTDEYKILLTHYPHLFAHYRKDYQYSDYNIDLIMAGHAHGGLIRLPFLKGLYAPGQGLFPRFTSGLYRQNGVTAVVSRGLGNSGLPFRINNAPDVVVVDLLPQ